MPKSKKYKKIINSNKRSFLSKLPKIWLLIGVVILLVFAWIGIVQISNYLERRDLNTKHTNILKLKTELSSLAINEKTEDIKYCSNSNQKYKTGDVSCVVGMKYEFLPSSPETVRDDLVRVLQLAPIEFENKTLESDKVGRFNLAIEGLKGCDAIVYSSELEPENVIVLISCIQKTNSQYFH